VVLFSHLQRITGTGKWMIISTAKIKILKMQRRGLKSKKYQQPSDRFTPTLSNNNPTFSYLSGS
jgi:hypothetical protein